MNQPKQKEWEKKFDKMFLNASAVKPPRDEVMAFIYQLLAQQRNELIKEIRRKLVAETTIGEHTMVVFDDIVSSLEITQAIKKVGEKK